MFSTIFINFQSMIVGVKSYLNYKIFSHKCINHLYLIWHRFWLIMVEGKLCHVLHFSQSEILKSHNENSMQYKFYLL